MGRLSGLLITVRSAKQGAEMERGKWSAEYQKEIATLRIHPEDLADLGLSPGQSVILASAYGQAEVTCRPTEGPKGLFFLPLGAVANQLFSAAHTHGTGVPDWKSLEVTLSPCDAQPGQSDEQPR
jgi:formylmethanofuran dehydrogenase subunit D